MNAQSNKLLKTVDVNKETDALQSGEMSLHLTVSDHESDQDDYSLIDVNYEEAADQLHHDLVQAHVITNKCSCEVCGKAYRYKVNLSRHRKKHANDILFQCHMCGKVHTSLPGLVCHAKVHQQNESKCQNGCPQKRNKSQCNKNLTSYQQADAIEFFNCKKLAEMPQHKECPQNHEPIHVVHGEQYFMCDQCGKMFKSKLFLDRHKTSHFAVLETNSTCKECGIVFDNPKLLKTHSLLHSLEVQNSFLCKQCGKRLTSRSSLSRHTQLHKKRTLLLEDVPYKTCENCGIAMPKDVQQQSDALETRGRLFCGEECRSAFRYKSSYSRKGPEDITVKIETVT